LLDGDDNYRDWYATIRCSQGTVTFSGSDDELQKLADAITKALAEKHQWEKENDESESEEWDYENDCERASE